MQKVTVNRDGSIGPFPTTTAAEEWLADRLVLLCTHRAEGDTGGADRRRRHRRQ